MASAASEPDPQAKLERTWATLAFRQSSGVKGFLVPDEPGGYWASAPRWAPVDISSWKRLPTPNRRHSRHTDKHRALLARGSAFARQVRGCRQASSWCAAVGVVARTNRGGGYPR